MNPLLAALAERQGGPFTRGQAITNGLHDDQLRHLTRIGTLKRLRRGAYVEACRLSGLTAVELHLLQVRAVALSLEPRVAFSHVSAAAVHGLDLWDVDLSDVHVTRRDHGAARTLAGVRHHVGTLPDDDLTHVEGLLAVSAARAVVEVAMTDGFDAGVIAADSALHRGRTTRKELDIQFEIVRQWPGATCVGSVVSHADGKAESVGETRSRLLFARQGLPVPTLQHNVYDHAGAHVGRVDFLFEKHRTVVEFDGKVKYRGDGRAASKTVVAEKEREDRIRELGYQVVRLIWRELDNPERVARKVRAAFARAHSTS